MSDFILAAVGVLCLYFGAEWLVTGASRIARNFGMSKLVIGATVVAFGTSLPEAVASIFAQLKGGRGDIALGNVIGSNIANIGLVLGLSALISPIAGDTAVGKREIPIMLGVSILLAVLMVPLKIAPWEGVLFLMGICSYVGYHVHAVSQMSGRTRRKKERHLARDLGLCALGSVGLVVGGHFLIKAAVAIATEFGISERVIGVTLVAFGTSLPELATSVVGVIKGEEDISLGNIVGSNIFNILFIVGLASVIAPLEFTRALLKFDVPVMLLFSLSLSLCVLRITRLYGALLLIGYLAYIFFLFV